MSVNKFLDKTLNKFLDKTLVPTIAKIAEPITIIIVKAKSVQITAVRPPADQQETLRNA